MRNHMLERLFKACIFNLNDSHYILTTLTTLFFFICLAIMIIENFIFIIERIKRDNLTHRR